MKNIFFRDDNKFFDCYLMYFKIICLSINMSGICKGLPFQAFYLLYIPSVLTFENSAFFTQYICVSHVSQNK